MDLPCSGIPSSDLETEQRHDHQVTVLTLAAIGAATACLGTHALAQGTIKIGELNSYKSQPAFLDPYKKGWELAVEEINAKGGVLGRKLEVISRDDGANPGDAVRVAEELVTREGVNILAGTFFSHIGWRSPSTPASAKCSSSPLNR